MVRLIGYFRSEKKAEKEVLIKLIVMKMDVLIEVVEDLKGAVERPNGESDREEMIEQKWMDKMDVIDYLKISESTYRRLKREGILVPKTIGRKDYYFQEDLDKAFKKGAMKR